MSNFKTCVIVNPNSCNGATRRRLDAIKRGLDSVLADYTLKLTEGPGHGTMLSRQALTDGHEMVVAVGGDGTVHEVVNGFFEAGKPVASSAVLGMLPSGTGGDYRKTWGFSNHWEANLGRLAGRETQTVDIGSIQWMEDGVEHLRYFVNIASIGLGGAVSKQANEQSKMLGGTASFMIASVRALMGYKNKKVQLSTDGGQLQPLTVTLAAFCIGRYCGGGMMMAPNANPSDGLFDVIVLKDAQRLEMVTTMNKVYTGRHLSHSKVSSWRGAHIRVEGERTGPERVLIEADGEVFGCLPADFKVIPQAFQVKV